MDQIGWWGIPNFGKTGRKEVLANICPSNEGSQFECVTSLVENVKKKIFKWKSYITMNDVET